MAVVCPLLFVGLILSALWSERKGNRISTFWPGSFGAVGIIGISITLAAMAMFGPLSPTVMASEIFEKFGIACIIYTCLAGGIVLYKAWSSIQDGNARTGPVAAVALMFIPIVNCVGIFIVLPGFVNDYNRFIERHNLIARPIERKRFVWAALWAVISPLFISLTQALCISVFGSSYTILFVFLWLSVWLIGLNLVVSCFDAMATAVNDLP